jgi:hypothetical protein
MTTPRIEEMMREFERFTIMDGNRISLYGEAEIAETWLRQALTQAHQAGIDEGKFQEKVKWETYQDEVESIFAWLHGDNGDFPDLSQKPHYSFRSQLRTMRKALDDTKKALQDKK